MNYYLVMLIQISSIYAADFFTLCSKQEKELLRKKREEIEEIERAKRSKVVVTFDLVGRKVAFASYHFLFFFHKCLEGLGFLSLMHNTDIIPTPMQTDFWAKMLACLQVF